VASNDLTFRIFGKDVSASRALKGVAGEADKAGKRFSGMGALAGAGLAVVGAAAVKFGADSVKAFTESQTSQTKLQDAYARFPALAGGNIDALRQLGAERAKVTRFDDDATAAAAAQLAQFGLNQGQLEQMIPLVQDYAAKTGVDLPTASGKVGKALLGNTKALKELGISYKPTGDKAKDYLAIQALLTKQVGGFAEKEGKSAAGQAAILGNQFGEVQETVGQALLPVLMTLADFAITTLIPAVQGIATFIGENSSVLIPLIGFVGALVAGIKVWTIAQAALNIVLALNPIGLIVIAIAALVAALVIAWNKSETFRAVVTAAWEGVKAAALTVVAWFQAYVWPTLQKVIGFIIGYYKLLWTVFSTVVKWIIDKGVSLVSWFSGLPERIRSAVSGLWDGIKDSFRNALNWIIRAWNNFQIQFPSFDFDWNGPLSGGEVTVGGWTVDTPNIPQLARGGIVSRPTLALIGEAGPEAVVPLSRGRGMGDTIIVHLHQPLGRPSEIARVVGAAVTRSRSNGSGS
jgi:phage-related protein